MTAKRRWGFRIRLTALIAEVFTLGGAVLLTVQYILVQQLLTSGISTITSGCVAGTRDELDMSCISQTGESGNAVFGMATGAGEVSIQQTTQLSRGVLSGLLTWSIVVLVAFASLAILAAWWLSKRSLGRIAQITSTTREITRDDREQRLNLTGPDDEIKELGDTIDGMLDRLDDAFTRQDRFIAGASHELRTPLTTTRTLLEIPLAQGRVPVDLEQSVRGALAANERSEHLIAALLTLARMRHRDVADSGREPADLTAIVTTELHERAAQIAQRDLSPSGPAPRPALAVGEPGLLRIAVANLIDNAIRHNRTGGDLIVSTGVEAGAAWIEIDNDGQDLAGADLSKFTEPFHRGGDSRLVVDGLGLGLALVETIVQSHGGSLLLTARVGGGLRARMSLPNARHGDSGGCDAGGVRPEAKARLQHEGRGGDSEQDHGADPAGIGPRRVRVENRHGAPGHPDQSVARMSRIVAISVVCPSMIC